jgi:hypothetical protein
MKKKIFLLFVIAAICLLNVTPVLASNTAVVTILGIPIYSGGILTFNVIYVSDTEMDLNWTVGAGVENVMVRAKYGTPPANPPDINTAPSDGYLVYYGSNLSAVDTSMDMNQNAGTLNYTAWAQKLDGTWNLVPKTNSQESREVVLIGLIALGAIGSIFAIYKRQVLFAVGASVVWFMLIAYTRANPLPNIAVGSSTDSLWIGVCVAFSVGTMLTTFIMRNSDEKEKVEKFRNSPNYRSEQDVNRNNSQGSSYESADDYQARLARTSRRKRN